FVAMLALGYPRARLGAPHITLVGAPYDAPRTKPKALDYALPLCAGEHVVVYDAEDIPDPDQLWKAVLAFRDRPELACQQARLVIDNGERGWLAGLFAAEYAALFGVLLPALARWHMPMPLGDTSNHFRPASLRQIGGWDAFNVAEDADLGMRLARRRMRVDTLDFNTREHAPARLRPFLGKRTRWMKGWMQTFIVHNRNPVKLIAEMGLGPALVFEVLVLGMIVAPLLHCGLGLGLLLQLALGTPLFDGRGWSVFYTGVLVLGYGSTFAAITLGLARQRRLQLLPPQCLLSLYWLLIAIATLSALIELLWRPFY
ncbi:MAG: glycosyltransferase, partial [Candidatus Devosia euplotis]|nr:glycosyltransferase [Candidatus Devosia euplotis]